MKVFYNAGILKAFHTIHNYINDKMSYSKYRNREKRCHFRACLL
jgi:hypothetical protein